jgi:hypothetical protein
MYYYYFAEHLNMRLRSLICCPNFAAFPAFEPLQPIVGPNIVTMLPHGSSRDRSDQSGALEAFHVK